MVALLCSLVVGAVTSQTPPPGLACLAQWYPVTAAEQDGRWVAITRSGRRLPWDAPAARSAEERTESPVLQDMFTPAYVTGAIHPVTNPEEDPGRTRVEALLDATYGATQRDVELASVLLQGHRVRVHRKVAPALTRVAARLQDLVGQQPSVAPFLTPPGGGFNWRPIAGTSRKSAHSWGIAVDLNVERSHYWRWETGGWKNRFPQSIVNAFEAEGFIWGGRWFHFDTMHFEYRPELLAPACRSTRSGP